ncbi:unnamed protein product [Sphagnum troendelagicum]|uniref:RRM domain-containing protein n=1 Tax=Sphagnum troendelagicum TaxID=128251 RepID=A0ABP0UV26_9BRYO
MLRSRQIMLSFLHCSCQLLGDPQRVTEDLSKKIFVGGLSPSVESDDLWDFFEEKYGPVLDAVVIGSQSGDHLQSRGFGFVTFKHVESVAAAVEAHYINIFGKKVEIKSAVPRSELPALDSARSDSNVQEQYSPLPADKMSEGSTPSWLIKFRQWLPTFLAGVSTRLNEGEWYPLSSLKGDFRATCGLELDHLALGYEKLSDFIRSLPEVCRMKIVPVGRGPATHMVLLPALTRPTPNFSQRPAVIGIQVPQGPCSQRTEVRTPARLPVTPEQEPTTPDHQLPAPLKPFAAFSHSFPSFLPDTPYSIWGPNVQDNRAKEVYNHQEFAQSILPLYGIPSGLPPALGQGYSGREGMCGLCSVRQALWVAVPCGHYGLCAACKDSLRQRNHAPTQCFLCYGYVERWIALH